MDILKIDASLLMKMFVQGTLNLNKDKESINALNVFPVPDGDTGTNMNLTMQSALTEMKKREHDTVEEVAKAISKGSLMGARGNSGVILSQIFRGFAKGLEGKTTIDSLEFAHAMVTATNAAYKAVLKPVEGTILTVVRETAEKADSIQISDMPFHDFFKILIKQANETLQDTPNHLDVLRQAGVVDAGGKGFISILNGFNNAILGVEINENLIEQVSQPQEPIASGPADVIKFQYCTEFIIRSKVGEASELRDEILKLGDSMVFVQDEEIVKVHIHTNNPGIAIESALKYGELVNVKIDNMKEQHENRLIAQTDIENKPYGFIAVASGEGISAIFEDLGVDEIIVGGQTMNPSTEDIMAAIDRVHADHIFILPNNSNIIMAANQARDLSEKEIIVIPSKTIPQGISCMVAYDEEAEPEKNQKNMTEILSDVKTVQLTYSVRDTQFADKEIREGDILGILDGEIHSVTQSVEHALLETMEVALDEDSEIVALYYGEEIDEATATQHVSQLEQRYPEVEFELYFGGQPLYYYLASIE